jgi:hypothetical protein
MSYAERKIARPIITTASRIQGTRDATIVRGMNSTHDRAIAARFSEACENSRRHLRNEMERLGLLAQDGWRISETVRAVQGGSELVMRPAHLYQPSPAGVECVVSIDMAAEVDSSCTP